MLGKKQGSKINIPQLQHLPSRNNIVNSYSSRDPSSTERRKLNKVSTRSRIREENQNTERTILVDDDDFNLVTQPATFIEVLEEEKIESGIKGHHLSLLLPPSDNADGNSIDNQKNVSSRQRRLQVQGIKKSPSTTTALNKFSLVHGKVKAIASIQLAGKIRRKELNQKVKQLSEYADDDYDEEPLDIDQDLIEESVEDEQARRDANYTKYLQEKKKLEKATIEDDINEKIKLEDIRRLFENSSEDGLSEDDFISGMSKLLESGRDRDEFKALFARIDANANGSVDWNEFSTYVLLGYEGAKKMKSNFEDKTFVKQTYPDINTKTMYHKGNISRITVDEKRQRYYTSGNDGLVKSWYYENLMFDRNIYYSPSSIITDISYLPLHDELCICNVDRVVSFYDLDTFNLRRAFKGRQYYNKGIYNIIASRATTDDTTINNLMSSTIDDETNQSGGGGGGGGNAKPNRNTQKLSSSLPSLSRRNFKECTTINMPSRLKDPNPLIETLSPIPNSAKVHKQIENMKNEYFTKPFHVNDSVQLTVLEDFIDTPTCMTDFSKFFVDRKMKEERRRSGILSLPNITNQTGDFVRSYSKQGIEIINPCFLMFGMDSGYVKLFDCTATYTGSSRVQESIMPEKKWKLHNGWVSKIIYAPSIDCMITSSYDRTISVTNFDDPKRGGRILQGHSMEVYSVDWCERHKLVVSCGRDKEIRLWNPFISSSLVTLHGHEKPVIDVKFNVDDRQIISYDTGKTVKVWDLRNYKLLQTMEDVKPESSYGGTNDSHKASFSGKYPGSAMMYHHKKSRVITANHKLKAWSMKRTLTEFSHEFKGHKSPVVACLYNDLLRQLITCDEKFVCVWDSTTGKLLFKFSVENKISNAILDSLKRRLIISSHNGEVSLWNYINGQKLLVCYSPSPSPLEMDEIAETTPESNETSLATQRMNQSAIDQETAIHSVGASVKGKSMSSLDYKGLAFVFKESKGIRSIAAGGNNKRVVFWKDDDQDSSAENYSHSSSQFPNDINVIRQFNDHLAVGLDNGTIVMIDAINGESKYSVPFSRIANLTYDFIYFINKQKRVKAVQTEGLPQPIVNCQIEDLLFLENRDGLLISARGNGIVSLWETRKSLVHLYSFQTTPNGEAISCLSCSTTNETIILGDSRGFIYVYDLRDLPRAKPVLEYTKPESIVVEKKHIRLVKSFKAHTESVTSLIYISGLNLIASCGLDCTVVLFDLYGIPIGFFGQRNEWKIGLDFTYGRHDINDLRHVINLDLSMYRNDDEKDSEFNQVVKSTEEINKLNKQLLLERKIVNNNNNTSNITINTTTTATNTGCNTPTMGGNNVGRSTLQLLENSSSRLSNNDLLSSRMTPVPSLSSQKSASSTPVQKRSNLSMNQTTNKPKPPLPPPTLLVSTSSELLQQQQEAKTSIPTVQIEKSNNKNNRETVVNTMKLNNNEEENEALSTTTSQTRYQKLREMEDRVSNLIEKSLKEQGANDQSTSPREGGEGESSHENLKEVSQRKAVEKYQKTLLWSQAHDTDWIGRVRTLIDVDDNSFERNIEDFMIDHNKIPTNTSLHQTVSQSSTTGTTTAKTTLSTPSTSNKKFRKEEKNIVSSTAVVVVEPNPKNKPRGRSIAIVAPQQYDLNSSNSFVPSPNNHHSPTHSDKLPHIFRGSDSATERRSQASSSNVEQNDRDFEKKINSLFSSLDITIKEINKVLI